MALHLGAGGTELLQNIMHDGGVEADRPPFSWSTFGVIGLGAGVGMRLIFTSRNIWHSERAR